MYMYIYIYIYMYIYIYICIERERERERVRPRDLYVPTITVPRRPCPLRELVSILLGGCRRTHCQVLDSAAASAPAARSPCPWPSYAVTTSWGMDGRREGGDLSALCGLPGRQLRATGPWHRCPSKWATGAPCSRNRTQHPAGCTAQRL